MIHRFIQWIRELFIRWKIKRIYKSGIAFNPLTKIRNKPCFCGSGLKSKKCCGQFSVLPSNTARALRAAIKYEKSRGRM